MALTSLPLLSTLALPERAYAVVGRFALDDATDIAALKSIVSGAKGWPACLEAWAAIGGGTPKPATNSAPTAGSDAEYACQRPKARKQFVACFRVESVLSVRRTRRWLSKEQDWSTLA